MKHVIISVISDLVTDQRVHRVASTLQRNGLNVTLVGRQLKKSLPLAPREYKTVRFQLWREKGMMFYVSYNLRLFFYLLFHQADVYVANDLDTLLPNFIASKLKRVELFYDSHEYFTEVPELVNRKRVQRIWKMIEQFIFPKLNHVYTVNESIAGLYEEKYKKKVEVVRNVPLTASGQQISKTRKDLNLPEDKKNYSLPGCRNQHSQRSGRSIGSHDLC